MIVNYESTYCDFDNVKWMKYFSDISITRFITGDQTKVYTIMDKATEKEINIAIKTCVLPAGV